MNDVKYLLLYLIDRATRNFLELFYAPAYVRFNKEDIQ